MQAAHVDAGHQQRVGHRQLAEVEQADRPVVERHLHESQQAAAGQAEDAERRHSVGGVQFGRDVAEILHHLRPPDGNTRRGDTEIFGQSSRQAGRQRPASHQQHRLGRRGIESQDLCRDRLRQFGHHRADVGDDLGGGKLMGNSQNIGKRHILAGVAELALQHLRHLEIQQMGLGYRLRHLVAGERHHAVTDDRPVAGDGDVGSACTHVDQREIEMAHGRRDKHVDRGDRLQSHGGYLQTRRFDRRLQRIDDLARQERRDHLDGSVFSPLADQRLHRRAVESEADHTVTDAVIAGGFGHRLRRRQLMLGCLDSRKLKSPLIVRRQGATSAAIGIRHGPQSAQRPAGGGHRNPLERPDPLDEARRHTRQHLSNLGHVVDLAVQHGAGIMLLALRGQHFNAAGRLLAHQADDAPRTDIQAKKQLLVIHSARSLSRTVR